LVRLPTAEKRYDPLTVHVWQAAGSKSGWQRRGPELLEGIAKTIQGKPNERFLVVHHKAGPRVPDVPREVAKLLPAWMTEVHNPERQRSGRMSSSPIGEGIRPATVGLTSPTSSWRGDHSPRSGETRRVLQAPQRGHPADHRFGEHMDLLLQAVCRGRVRKLDGDKCLPMHAYVIAAPASGIPGALGTVFPGCKLQRWRRTRCEGQGQACRRHQYFRAIGRRWPQSITYKSLRGYVGLKDLNNLAPGRG